MAGSDPKTTLHRYLQTGRDAVLWKLEGLSEYDVRRPLVRTGTNLLGLVKHLACVELGYFGETFERPSGETNPWFEEGVEDNVDMWPTPEESREDLVALYRRACSHADVTIEALNLDAPGRVPWWPEDNAAVTLHQILVHVVAETHRHAGHADLVRELIDGAAGYKADDDNLPSVEPDWWQSYRDRVERAAREAGGTPGAI
jgi:uncharacterized damage-inducible protein DinB